MTSCCGTCSVGHKCLTIMWQRIQKTTFRVRGRWAPTQELSTPNNNFPHIHGPFRWHVGCRGRQMTCRKGNRGGKMQSEERLPAGALSHRQRNMFAEALRGKARKRGKLCRGSHRTEGQAQRAREMGADPKTEHDQKTFHMARARKAKQN